jgi:hypothetical protein
MVEPPAAPPRSRGLSARLTLVVLQSLEELVDLKSYFLLIPIFRGVPEGSRKGMQALLG